MGGKADGSDYKGFKGNNKVNLRFFLSKRTLCRKLLFLVLFHLNNFACLNTYLKRKRLGVYFLIALKLIIMFKYLVR